MFRTGFERGICKLVPLPPHHTNRCWCFGRSALTYIVNCSENSFVTKCQVYRNRQWTFNDKIPLTGKPDVNRMCLIEATSVNLL